MSSPKAVALAEVARIGLCASGLALAACAQVPADPVERAEFERTNDPAEPTNRTIFAGNQFVDRNALRPVARGYNEYVPDGVRRGLHNFVQNLGEPAIAVNDLLQGNAHRAWNTTQRFAINTTVGGLVYLTWRPTGTGPDTTPTSGRRSASGASGRGRPSSYHCSGRRTCVMASARSSG